MNNGIPDAGDILWLNVGPSAGNEQDGYRPALVLTDAEFNALTHRFIGLPITSAVHGWESEIPISGLSKPCVAMADQITTLSLTARVWRFRGEAATEDEFSAARFAVAGILNL
ncbi:type II toxin-antitoxin system PemK/MazF family toxin [Paraburkholderia sp. J67]|uniref:type II toxin-antitoxin system PemK/MazF family toxin n=1 Tax=Paraburkholderia sp. J67 TaxID=2805435 RepID=UPI002ABE4486|nr:type II toxin-antitoxin system PemK/MazF family toxin [Paraburkholderia sp. J67]